MALSPPRWTEQDFERDAAEAILHFRQTRMHEPLEAYLDHFEKYRRQVESLIEETADLTDLTGFTDPTGRVRLDDRAVELLTGPERLTTIRYLASPAISEDDVKVLADAVLSPKRLRADPGMARRVIGTVLLGLDRERFPWVGEDRDPTEAERRAAVVATAALIATQKVQTGRRNEAKKTQEGAVAGALRAAGLTEVPPRTIANMSHVPGRGEFCAETLFGSRKADLVVRLWDGRVMPTECKVSNSSTNSVKRLNNDAAVKAKTWIQEFGTMTCVPAAVLSGVFKVRNLVAAQSDGLVLFWAHGLEEMVTFVEGTREDGQ
jgi:type-2 restriction enzyme xamI